MKTIHFRYNLGAKITAHKGMAEGKTLKEAPKYILLSKERVWL